MTTRLDSRRFKKVSAFQNNCALASGANLIVEELLAVPDDVIDTTDAAAFRWKGMFLHYYDLAACTPLSAIRDLIKKFPHPRDQQSILSPVLRLMLIDLLPVSEKPLAASLQFLAAAKAATLFNHLGFSLDAHIRAEDDNQYTVYQHPVADASKTLKIVHNANYDGLPAASWHWETLAEDDTSAAAHNTAFAATDNRLPVDCEPDQAKRIVTEAFAALSVPAATVVPTVVQLKTNWLALIEAEKAKANAQSDATSVKYHYFDDANNVVTFWTSKIEQEKIDRLLAERLGREDDLAGEFNKLPKYNS